MNTFIIHTTYGETTAPYNYIQDIIIEESVAGKEEKQPKNVSFADISAPRDNKQVYSPLSLRNVKMLH
jgi:hypothetical protein